jgi:hypothetical protein
VSAGGVDAYVNRLREELRRRWIDDDRLVAEAREHLVDRIAAGIRGGLTREAAEQQAIREFGSPETIAACSAAERYPMNERWGFIGMMWDRKWSIIMPALAAAMVTGITSYYVVPVRYQSEAFLEFIPVGTPDTRDDAGDHVRAMSAVLESSTRLERIIEELNLYADERQTSPIESLVRRMRHDISVIAEPEARGSDTRAFVVRFESSDPRLAQRGTERLASLFVDEHFRGGGLRQIGTQLKIVEPPRAPEQPVGLSPAQFGAMGGGGGLMLGLIFIASRRRHLA